MRKHTLVLKKKKPNTKQNNKFGGILCAHMPQKYIFLWILLVNDQQQKTSENKI